MIDNHVSVIQTTFTRDMDIQSFQFLMEEAMKELERHCKEEHNIEPSCRKIMISFDDDLKNRNATRMTLRYKHRPEDKIVGHERGI